METTTQSQYPSVMAQQACVSAVKAAKMAAESARLTVQYMTLYLKNDTRKNLTGKTAHKIAKQMGEEIGHSGARDWKHMTAEEQALWSFTAQLMTERPPISPDLTVDMNASQQLALQKCREIMAGHRITKTVRAARYTDLFQTVRTAANTVYTTMDWGWNEKVFQEALKTELDHVSTGGYHLCSEIAHTIFYRGKPMGDGVNARTDILLTERSTGRQLLLELKAVTDSRSSMDKAVQQCKRYLRMKQMSVGMVINFPDRGAVSIKSQIVFA